MVDDTSDRFRLDLARLDPWLRERFPELTGAIAAQKFAGGQSNPTYAILVDGQPRMVLRKKPPGVLLPSAHAVEREYKVTAALAGTGVPVARPLALCEDPDVVGTPFFVMEHASGRNFWDARLPDMQPAERAAIYDAMITVLARLHAPERPANAATALRALTPPLADTARYDRLRRMEADHA